MVEIWILSMIIKVGRPKNDHLRLKAYFMCQG